MKLFAAVFLTAAFALAAADAGMVFRLPGWENARQLKTVPPDIFKNDNVWLETAVCQGRLFLFYKTEGFVYMAEVKNGALISTEIVDEADPYTEPVVKVWGEVIYVLTYHNHLNKFYRITPGGEIEKLHQHKSEFNFGYDFFPFENVVILSHPVRENGNLNLQLEVLIKFGNIYNIRVINFPALSKESRGNFFPQIRLENGYFNVSYISRRQSDILCQIRTRDIMGLEDEKGEEVRHSSRSGGDYPPIWLKSGKRSFLLFPSKDPGFFRLFLDEIGGGAHGFISPKRMNTYRVKTFIDDIRAEIFYIGYTQNNAGIWRKIIDVNSLSGKNDYAFDDEGGERATSDNLLVHYMATAEKGGERYLFFSPEGESRIYFTKTDRSVEKPLIISRMVERPKSDGSVVTAPVFTWKTPEDSSGIQGYAAVFDHESETIPAEVNLSADTMMFDAADLADREGLWYFHISAHDGAGNWSAPLHLAVQVDFSDSHSAHFSTWPPEMPDEKLAAFAARGIGKWERVLSNSIWLESTTRKQAAGYKSEKAAYYPAAMLAALKAQVERAEAELKRYRNLYDEVIARLGWSDEQKLELLEACRPAELHGIFSNELMSTNAAADAKSGGASGKALLLWLAAIAVLISLIVRARRKEKVQQVMKIPEKSNRKAMHKKADRGRR